VQIRASKTWRFLLAGGVIVIGYFGTPRGTQGQTKGKDIKIKRVIISGEQPVHGIGLDTPHGARLVQVLKDNSEKSLMDALKEKKPGFELVGDPALMLYVYDGKQNVAALTVLGKVEIAQTLDTVLIKVDNFDDDDSARSSPEKGEKK